MTYLTVVMKDSNKSKSSKLFTLKHLHLSLLNVTVISIVLLLVNQCCLNSVKQKRVEIHAYHKKTTLAVLVLSRRDAFAKRESIRQTWPRGHSVFFLVAEQFCQFPPEHRVPGSCTLGNKTITKEILQQYQAGEEENTDRLRHESEVVLLPLEDVNNQFSSKVLLGYMWALRNTDADWILITHDETAESLTDLEAYLQDSYDPNQTLIIKPALGKWPVPKGDNLTKIKYDLEGYQTVPVWSVGYVLSRSAAQDIVDDMESLTEQEKYQLPFTKNMITSSPKLSIEQTTGKSITNDTAKIDSIGPIAGYSEESKKKLSHSQQRQALLEEPKVFNSRSEIPSAYLNSDRFDVIIKIVYAYFYAATKVVPKPIKLAYTEHLRVWNHFREKCNSDRRWFDAYISCKEKRHESDYISSFHATIESIREHGFLSNTSQIPVDSTGYPLNGAHRLASAIVLGKNATFQHLNYRKNYKQNFWFYAKRGLARNLTNLVMLEWMRIQTKLPDLKMTVSILSVYSKKPKYKNKVRETVIQKCSKDKGILYEHEITVNKLGMIQLMKHLYGDKPWVKWKIKEMCSLFKSEIIITYIFFFGKDPDKLKECKEYIRKMYDYAHFKSSAHIPDTPEENLILAEMILNPNSVEFLNKAKNGNECQTIATELAHRSDLKPVSTLPEIYIGREDLMVDSGSVLYWFNLRNRTDVDILFLNEIDNHVLRKKNGIKIEAHAFKSNEIPGGKALGEDHFNEEVETKWDLFYDPDNFGFCYGIKFVSLKQLLRYKLQRKDQRKKDQNDVRLISKTFEVS